MIRNDSPDPDEDNAAAYAASRGQHSVTYGTVSFEDARKMGGFDVDEEFLIKNNSR